MLFFRLLGIGMIFLGFASGKAEVKLGVRSADASSADLAALLTVELGREPGVAVVERDKLARILDEQ